ncbi:MAG: iron-sulfur cluster assembly scaffold protein [Sneathiellaceae bacterium]
MLDDVYNEKILAFAAEIPRTERLQSPDATVALTSPLCGSRVTVDVVLDGDRVADFGQEVRACALGSAAASIVGHGIVGRTTTEVREAREALRAMLKEGGPPPGGVWSDLEILTPARAVKARHRSIMLAFDALDKAFTEIEAARDAGRAEGTTRAALA